MSASLLPRILQTGDKLQSAGRSGVFILSKSVRLDPKILTGLSWVKSGVSSQGFGDLRDDEKLPLSHT